MEERFVQEDFNQESSPGVGLLNTYVYVRMYSSLYVYLQMFMYT